MSRNNLGFIVSAACLIIIAAILYINSLSTDLSDISIKVEPVSDMCKVNIDSLGALLEKSGKIDHFKMNKPIIGDVNELKVEPNNNATKGLKNCLKQCSKDQEKEVYIIPVKSFSIENETYLELPCCLIVELKRY